MTFWQGEGWLLIGRVMHRQILFSRKVGMLTALISDWGSHPPLFEEIGVVERGCSIIGEKEGDERRFLGASVKGWRRSSLLTNASEVHFCPLSFMPLSSSSCCRRFFEVGQDGGGACVGGGRRCFVRVVDSHRPSSPICILSKSNFPRTKPASDEES